MTRAAAPPKQSEQAFQQQVIDYAHLMSWKVAHFRGVRVARKDGSVYYQTPVQADGAGFPDLVLARPPRIMFVELKAERGVSSPAQDMWLELLVKSGQDMKVWRPSDWPEIERTLQR